MHDSFGDPFLSPPARGLNLDALAAMGLEGCAGTAPAPPEIDGYRIREVLGRGASSIVWRAERLEDGVTVALKIAQSCDEAMAERLRAEADSLRSLRHPHIVRCLSHGVGQDRQPWLALEYVAGAPLSVLVPDKGFLWGEAWRHFRAIASAVVHAHAQGVLHRDLKPANILIGENGALKVADFGLARPVSERVLTFSLTVSGHIAGTAEYLAPECYARNYRPAPAADIYALGVILYELLAGHPPRGAWSPISSLKQVDIRVDEALQRAMEPDPSLRFPSAQAFLAEIERIARTPPRYSGTPRLTPAVRFLDAAWTFIGLFLLLGAVGIVVRIEKYGFILPVDLIGVDTIRIGTFQSVLVLLLAAAPCGVWQLFRLWRFRGVPLREALPVPFGLRLGGTRTAAVSLLLAQIFLVLAPAGLMAFAWREKCMDWLNATTPPWGEGLVFVDRRSYPDTACDPWGWPEPDGNYWLVERRGWIHDPLGSSIDQTKYAPGFTLRLIAGLAAFHVMVVMLSALSAFMRWWRFRQWGKGAALLALMVLSDRGVRAEARSHAGMQERLERQRMRNDAYARDLAIHQATTAIDFLVKRSQRRTGFPVEEILARTASTLRFAERPPATGDGRREALEDCGHRFSTPGRWMVSVTSHLHSSPHSRRFVRAVLMEDCEDPPGGEATGSLLVLTAYGQVFVSGQAEMDILDFRSFPLWKAEPRELDRPAAESWAEALFPSMAATPPPQEPDPLADLFLPVTFGIGHAFGGEASDPTLAPVPAAALVTGLRAAWTGGARPRLVQPPGPAEKQPGGHRRVRLEIEDRGEPVVWTADLVFTGGEWKCARLVFRDEKAPAVQSRK